jgi:uncharacterized protein DUF1508
VLLHVEDLQEPPRGRSNGQMIGSAGESFASRANAVRSAENVKGRAGQARILIDEG